METLLFIGVPILKHIMVFSNQNCLGKADLTGKHNICFWRNKGVNIRTLTETYPCLDFLLIYIQQPYDYNGKSLILEKMGKKFSCIAGFTRLFLCCTLQ